MVVKNKQSRTELKNKKKRDKEFKKIFNIVLSKVRRLKLKLEQKRILVADLYECNNIDLVHYLSTETFTTTKEYYEAINAWLDLETKAFDYAYKIYYKAGYMGNITEMIRLHHNARDLKRDIEQ